MKSRLADFVIAIGARNAEAATSLRWRQLDETMRAHGYQPITVGSKRVYRASDVIEMLETEATASKASPDQSEAEVLAELRAGLGRQLRRAG